MGPAELPRDKHSPSQIPRYAPKPRNHPRWESFEGIGIARCGKRIATANGSLIGSNFKIRKTQNPVLRAKSSLLKPMNTTIELQPNNSNFSTSAANDNPLPMDSNLALSYLTQVKEQYNKEVAAHHVAIYRTNCKLEEVGGTIDYKFSILGILEAGGGELPMSAFSAVLPDRDLLVQARDQLAKDGKIVVDQIRNRKILTLVRQG